MSDEKAVERLASGISRLCAEQWDETLECWRVVQRWPRRYSDVQLIECTTNRSTRRLIGKRSTYHEDNATYCTADNVAAHEFEALRDAARALRDFAPRAVPQAYQVVPQEQLILMEYIAGSSFSRRLDDARWFAPQQRLFKAESLFEALGAWLRSYQTNTACPVGRETIHRALDETRRRLRQLGSASLNIPSEQVRQMMDRLEMLGGRVAGPIEGCSCHGDFGPWNVLESSGRLTVIDFLCQRNDSIWVDPLNILTYLQTQVPSVTLDGRRVERMKDAFVAGYGRQLDVQDAAYQFCLASRQVSRLQDAVFDAATRWTDRYRRRKVVRRLVKDLIGR